MKYHPIVCSDEKEMEEKTEDENSFKRYSAKWLYQRSKFGMFIHWGLYSLLASTYQDQMYYGISEWIMHPQMANIPVENYKAYTTSFDPKRFNATYIVQLAKFSGMKYIIMTAKHHDGFAMFHTKVGNFGIAQTPWRHVDPIREISVAARKEGLGFGIYYSHNQDWTFPGGTGGPTVDTSTGQQVNFQEYFDQKCLPQIQELTTLYGDLDMIWFDTPHTMPKVYVQKLVSVVRKNQPGALISGRVGYGLGDYETLGDMEIPVRRRKDTAGLWECVDTVNDSWGYASYDQNWKTPKQILTRLLSCVARGGTYLLNIGPNADGEIVRPTSFSLDILGRWMAQYAYTIYGTEGSPWDHCFPWGDVTQKDNSLYLFIFEWPRNGVIYLPALQVTKEQIISVSFATTTVEETLPQNHLKTEQQIPFEINCDDGLLILHFVSLPLNDVLVPVIEIVLSDASSLVVDSTWMIDPSMQTEISSEFALTQGGLEKSTHRWMEKFGEWKSVVRVHRFSNSTSKAVWEVLVANQGYYSVGLAYSGIGRLRWKITLESSSESIQNEQASSHIYDKFPIGWLFFPHKGRFSVSVHCTSTEDALESASLASIFFHPVHIIK
jgi:alpha-L-fucosidase